LADATPGDRTAAVGLDDESSDAAPQLIELGPAEFDREMSKSTWGG
jgi:hypothetical protein